MTSKSKSPTAQGISRQYALTRDDLIEALTRIKIRPVAGKVVAEWMADAILETLDDLAAGEGGAIMTEPMHAHEYDANGDKRRCPFPACWWNSTLAEQVSLIVTAKEGSQP